MLTYHLSPLSNPVNPNDNVFGCKDTHFLNIPQTFHELFAYFVEKTLAGVLKQFDDQLEVTVTAVVRVGYGGVVGMVAQIVSHHHYLFLSFCIGSHGGDGAEVVAVHYDDEVEVLEVLTAYLSGMAVEVVAVLVAMAAHACVGQLTYVPVSDASGVDEEVVLHVVLTHDMLHDSLGCR